MKPSSGCAVARGAPMIVMNVMTRPLFRTSVVLAPFLALLSACGGGGSGSSGNGGGTSTAPPRPGERRILTLTDAASVAVKPNEILTTRAAVARGDDVILFTPVGGTINGTSDTAAIRLAKDGSVKWARRYRFPELAFVGEVVDDGAGVSFVAGQDATVYVVRIDDDGAIRAQQAYEVPGAGQLSATVPLTLAPLDDHGLLVGTGAGVMRLAADGAVMWSNDLGGAPVQRVTVLPGGDFAAVGDIGGMRVARFSPDGQARFIGAGGIKGNFFHAGIVPTDDGGVLVLSGVDAASEELVGIVTGRISADGTTGTLEGVQMDVKDNMGHDVPYQFGSGAHIQRTASGRVWASFRLSSGVLGANLHGPVDVAFDSATPTDAVSVAIAFAYTDSAVVGIEPDGLGKDLVVRAPRPQEGECANQPYNLHTKALATATYVLVENAKVSPVNATPVDALVVADELKAELSEDMCPGAGS